jgi:hypothetical protein
LRHATKDIHATNTVVLSGLKLKEANFQDESGEIDFLIVSLPLKSIIHIEAKKGNSNSNRRKASAQLKRGMTFFEENFPFPVSEKWNYIKMMCFGESVETDICDQCKPFVLSGNFIETNKTQAVAEQVANQFKSFWSSCKPYTGKIQLLGQIRLFNLGKSKSKGCAFYFYLELCCDVTMYFKWNYFSISKIITSD